MKFLATVCLIFALFFEVLGFKNSVCNQEPRGYVDTYIICAGYMPRFTYYAESNSCQEYIYNGCFEICGLPHSGNGDGKRSCMGFFPSWSYNSDKNECIEFIYGGCGGNDNRFGSKEICEDKCLE
ncbi:hypothetical protein M5D96_003721 [Drosophila gunungcola]|uniref:BPTI/Kunitz inhibitor domain-containing protein n=1 Tax=Drosophila gunungcola TaxID=103775 RepID=A0A9P9YSQ0_9MUSC|nr:hypothetical protein M5D96_003721 [Drosophila gunungcola]